MSRSRLCQLGWAMLATACAHGIEADPRAFDDRGAAAGSAGWPAGDGGASGTRGGSGGLAGTGETTGHAGNLNSGGSAGSAAGGQATMGGAAGTGGNASVGGSGGVAGSAIGGGNGGGGAGGGAGAGGVQSDGGGGGGNAGAVDAGMGGRRSDAGVVCGATIPPKSTWVATASVNGSLAPLAVDADTRTRYTTGRSQAGDEWLQVDFGITATIDEVTLDTSSSNDYPAHWQVRLSGTSVNLAAPVVVEGDGTSPNIVIRFPATARGRYLLISQTGVNSAHWWSVHELGASCL
jgi:F5/8 type C domain-containing protein